MFKLNYFTASNQIWIIYVFLQVNVKVVINYLNISVVPEIVSVIVPKLMKIGLTYTFTFEVKVTNYHVSAAVPDQSLSGANNFELNANIKGRNGGPVALTVDNAALKSMYESTIPAGGFITLNGTGTSLTTL